jgi:hypothetical protein
MLNRSRRSSIIESNNSRSRISRSIRARTASLPDKIKFIEIPRTLFEIMLPEFCDKPDKALTTILSIFRTDAVRYRHRFPLSTRM